MSPEEVARLQSAFERPERWVDDRPTAQAATLLREHVIERIDVALAEAGVAALAVKGAALAESVYPEPWMRTMSDVDLLVSDAQLESAIRALASAGFEVDPRPADRRLSYGAFNEVMLSYPVGPGSLLVELHTSLDKVVRRPVDLPAIVSRSRCWKRALSLPALEDHLLIVVLHAATADFDHAVAWLDLHLLLGRKPDLEVVLARAAAWSLSTPLYVAARALRDAGSDLVPAALLSRCRPHALRERAVKHYFDLGRFPLHAGNRDDGFAWVTRQTPLRDDTLRWLAGCARYAATRSAERWLPR